MNRARWFAVVPLALLAAVGTAVATASTATASTATASTGTSTVMAPPGETAQVYVSPLEESRPPAAFVTGAR